MLDLTFSLDAASPLPLYEQLYRHLLHEINEGRIKSGVRLPSRRALSRHLLISEQTVNNALDLLRAEGYLESRPRQGLYVAQLLALGSKKIQAAAPLQHDSRDVQFDFSTQGADISLFPYKIWARKIREVLYEEPQLMSKGNARGEASLRQALSDFLYQYRGVHCPAEDLIIGSGVDQLLGIVGALLDPHQGIAFEDPGYPEASRALQRAGHHSIFLPMDRQGIRAEDLETSGASCAYLTPAHQFPTGISMPAGRRSELLYWASSSKKRYLIEDDYDSEFRYQSRPLPALQGMDRQGRTIYIGTFSRSLAPGIRVAYMGLPKELSLRYQELALRSGDAVSRFEQAALARLLDEGHYSRHLRRAGNAYQKRNEMLCQALMELPGVRLRGQEAGLHFLMEVGEMDEEELITKAAAKGIPLQGLSAYCVKSALPPALVMGFAALQDDQVLPAVEALRQALDI